MLDFYEKHGFKLFPCSLSKAPEIPKKTDWRDSINHLSTDEAILRTSKGGLVGAWIPENYVVIDIDVNHKDKLGNSKEDGLKQFLEIANEQMLKDTLVVKTGSGGYHLYYKNSGDIKQGKLASSIDIKTHSGYVIASGSPGYEVHTYNDIEVFPELFKEIIATKSQSKSSNIFIKDPLSTKTLKRVLNKLKHENFNNNDLWLELIMACIATAGNTPDVIDILEEWSKKDPAYADDTTIRGRIESLDPSGGITPATFLFILRREGISDYVILQVRKEIGAISSISSTIKDDYIMPFKLPLERVSDFNTIAKAFFYHKDQANASRLFVELTKDNLMYSRGEKQFYFFHRNRWEPLNGILKLIYTVLLRAADEYYIQFASKDSDGDEALGTIMGTLGTANFRQKILLEISQDDGLVEVMPPWDSPKIAETLTLNDGVVDFTGPSIVYREGKQEEFRRSYIDISIEDVKNAQSPENFKEFITDIFPNKDTRRLAIWALSLMVSGTGKFRKFQIWNGAGRNGKSTLKEVISEVIGDKAITYNPEILLQKHGAASGQLTPDLARFQGALVALASETEEGKKISQGTVKNITGDETITANPKYRDVITFETTFQLVLTTNYLPSFSAHDGAFIDRLLVLPFNTRFYKGEEDKEKYSTGKFYLRPAKDPKEMKKGIMEERAGILKLLISRYIKREEMPTSKESKDLLSHYISENDLFGNFVDYYLEVGEEFFTSTKELTEVFNEEYNTRYTATFIVRRLKEILMNTDIRNGRGKKDGVWQRGLLGVRLKDQRVQEEF